MCKKKAAGPGGIAVARTLERQIKADLAQRLRDWMANKLPGARVFTIPREFRKTMYRDLRLAGIPQGTPDGQIDVHALRHTFGTELARAGVSSKLIERLMRHGSDSVADRYIDFDLAEGAQAVERLPDYHRMAQALSHKATGTDSDTIGPDSEKYVQNHDQQYA